MNWDRVRRYAHLAYRAGVVKSLSSRQRLRGRACDIWDTLTPEERDAAHREFGQKLAPRGGRTR